MSFPKYERIRILVGNGWEKCRKAGRGSGSSFCSILSNVKLEAMTKSLPVSEMEW